jgi:hypothetical protein
MKITLVGEDVVNMQTWELTTALHRQGLSKAAIEALYGVVENERWCLETVCAWAFLGHGCG